MSFDPSRVKYNIHGGYVDLIKPTQPEEGSAIQVSGWAADLQNGAPAKAVVITADGGQLLVVPITGRSSRQDVAEAYANHNLLQSGWNVTFPASLLGKGKHRIQFYAAFPDGYFAPLLYKDQRFLEIEMGGEVVVRSCADILGGKSSGAREEEIDDLVPPQEMIFVGPGDFKDIGKTFFRYFIELADLKPDEKVLDVGCGIGRMAIPLTTYLSKEGCYEGFDIVPEGIKWCTEKISGKCRHFSFRQADIFNKYYYPQGRNRAVDYSFPYEDEYFDFVFLTSVFTHMLPKEVENYLHQISRVLKKNGRCLITFFLLNDESVKLITSGKSTLDFRHRFVGDKEAYLTVNKDKPENAIALKEEFILRLYERARLEVAGPIYYGSWCGREYFFDYQDIIVAYKR